MPSRIPIPGLPSILNRPPPVPRRSPTSRLQPIGMPTEIQPQPQPRPKPGIDKTDWFALLAPLISTGIGAAIAGKTGAAVGFSGGAQAGANYFGTKIGEEERLRQAGLEEQGAARAEKTFGMQQEQFGINKKKEALESIRNTGTRPVGWQELGITEDEAKAAELHYQQTQEKRGLETEASKLTVRQEKERQLLEEEDLIGLTKFYGGTSEAKTRAENKISGQQLARKTLEVDIQFKKAQTALYSQRAQDNERYWKMFLDPNVSDEVKAEIMPKITDVQGNPAFSPQVIEAEKQKSIKKIGDVTFRDIFVRMVGSGVTLEDASAAAKRGSQDLIALHGSKFEDIPLSEDQKRVLDIIVRQNINKTLEKFEEMVYLSTEPRLSDPRAREHAIKRFIEMKPQKISIWETPKQGGGGTPAPEETMGTFYDFLMGRRKTGVDRPDSTKMKKIEALR